MANGTGRGDAGEPGGHGGRDVPGSGPGADAAGASGTAVGSSERRDADPIGPGGADGGSSGRQGADPLEAAAFDEVTDDISDVSIMDIPVLIIFWLLFLIVALQFFTRYVLNDSLAWTEEIARFFLIFLAFVGSISCIRRGSHIYLEFFYRYLPPAAIKPLSLFVEAVIAVFFASAGWYGIGLAQKTSAQRMISVDLPKGIVYWVVVVACFAMALAAIVNIVRLARRPAAEVAASKLDPSNMAGA